MKTTEHSRPLAAAAGPPIPCRACGLAPTIAQESEAEAAGWGSDVRGWWADCQCNDPGVYAATKPECVARWNTVPVSESARQPKP